MKVTSTLNMGNNAYTFEADEKDDRESMLKAIALANPRTYCNVCKDSGLDNKTLNARKAKGFVFVNVRCGNCGAQSGMGEYKDGGFYWKEYEAFEKTPNRSHEELSEEDYTA